MKKLLYPALAAFILMSTAFMSITSQEWKIAPDFSIKFISKDPTGVFKEFTGSINFDENDLAAAKFDLTIPVASINMGNGMKNKHGRSEDWFDAEKYPNITYKSTAVEKTSNGYLIVGDMKIKGITKQYKIPVDFKKTGETGKFTGTFNVNRLDFKIGNPGKVAEVLKVEFSVPVNKK